MLSLACLAIALSGIIAIEAAPHKRRGLAPLPVDVTRLGPVVPQGGDIRQVQTWADIILARPLFEPSRRPPAAAPGPGTSGPGFPRLTGIIIMPQQREAIFAVPGKTQPIVVTAGSRLNGVLIKSIEPGAVVVVDAAGARMIRPSFATVNAAAAAAAPATPIMVDQPPIPPAPHTNPFASIRGLSGRPLGLAAEPDTTPPDGGAIPTAPSFPAPAPSGGSP
jgi:hypothetical protein